MYRLTEFYDKIMKKPLPTRCGIVCEIVDPDMAKLNRLLTESISCFSYTLVISGTAFVSYDDRFMELANNDILVYTPGMMIKTLEVSDDFSALCLMGDEAITYEIPFARNIVNASYFPAVAHSENKLTLTDCEAHWLATRMREMHSYIESEHLYKNECLYSLYSLFIMDLLNVEKRIHRGPENNGSTTDLFLKFMRLLTENFACHHDIAYYADALAVTPIYLSRIVKKYSGQTVKNHVDRLLAMEASFMLSCTDSPVSLIAEKLNFSNPSSFCKFFIRNKGVSPKEYRAACSLPYPTSLS